MHIDLSKELVNEMDQVYKGEDGLSFTAKFFIVRALSLNQEDTKDFFKKCEAYELFKKVKNAEFGADFADNEIDAIKEAVGKVFGFLICGQIEELFNGSKKA